MCLPYSLGPGVGGWLRTGANLCVQEYHEEIVWDDFDDIPGPMDGSCLVNLPLLPAVES